VETSIVGAKKLEAHLPVTGAGTAFTAYMGCLSRRKVDNPASFLMWAPLGRPGSN
jgi:hypothetical protein